MSLIEETIHARLEEILVAPRNPAWMEVSEFGEILGFGGALADYGLFPREGQQLSDTFPYVSLQGQKSQVIECIEIEPGLPIDVHVLPLENHLMVLILRAGRNVTEVMRMQQKLNETSLNFEAASASLAKSKRDARQGFLQYESLFGDLLFERDTLILERQAERSFSIVGALPATWPEHCYPGLVLERKPFDPVRHIPFLDLFLEEARQVWAEEAETSELRSDPWQETGENQEVRYFRAKALSIGKRALLLVYPTEDDFQEKQILLQTARRAALEHRELEREIQKKDVLLHCIVHDLKNPLTNIMSIFQILQFEDDEKERAEMLEIGSNQVQKQSAMIQDILEAFKAEYDDWNPEKLTPDQAPLPSQVVRELTRSMERAFSLKGIGFSAKIEADIEAVKVIAEARQLDRVVANLIENSLRHTPDKGEVLVSCSRENDAEIQIAIEDSGHGVPVEEQEKLFRKFSQGEEATGSSGLGLYFCRITVEKWGGSICYFDSDLGGAGFRICLPMYSHPA